LGSRYRGKCILDARVRALWGARAGCARQSRCFPTRIASSGQEAARKRPSSRPSIPTTKTIMRANIALSGLSDRVETAGSRWRGRNLLRGRTSSKNSSDRPRHHGSQASGEQHVRTLLREFSASIKRIFFAVVQAMSRHTARGSDSIEGLPTKSFPARTAGRCPWRMTYLFSQDWRGASMHELCSRANGLLSRHRRREKSAEPCAHRTGPKGYAEARGRAKTSASHCTNSRQKRIGLWRTLLHARKHRH